MTGQVVYKILNALAAKDWITRQEIMQLTGLLNMQSQQTLCALLSIENVERVKCGTRYYYWRITESGRQEHEKLQQKYGPIPLDETCLRAIKNRDIDVIQQRSLERQKLKLYMKEHEAKIKKSFRDEKALRANESGIRRYFLYDLSNPVDAEIVQRIEHTGRQELLCKQILTKRLGKNLAKRIVDDQLIEQKLLQHCLQTGKTRTEYVRQLFCIHFNIKEGVQTHNPDLNLTEGVACLN